MNRTGLAIAFVVAAVTGVLFGFYPELDLTIAGLFYQPGTGFGLGAQPLLTQLRDAAMIIVGLLVAPAIVALVVKLAAPRYRMLVPARASVLLISTLILGPLLAANITLKDNWGRPRPRDVVEFGGDHRFVPWWDPRGACEANCSFVAGEAAGAFWTLAPAALTPPQWRPLAYAGALAFGAAVSALRMGFGGHFFSDVVFAGAITFLIIWLVHGLLYRWPATRISDAGWEGMLERLAAPLRRPFRRRPRAEGSRPAARG